MAELRTRASLTPNRPLVAYLTTSLLPPSYIFLLCGAFLQGFLTEEAIESEKHLRVVLNMGSL